VTHARSIALAARAADAGLQNVTFVETNTAHFSSDSLFDAAVGRYIIQFLSDPVATGHDATPLRRCLSISSTADSLI
jgi:hypothetical protein